MATVDQSRLTQYLVTLGDGRQVLVDAWDTGDVEVSERPAVGDGWLPLVLTGGAVEVLRPVTMPPLDAFVADCVRDCEAGR